MSVEIYAGVGYGFTLRGNRDEIQEEIDKLGYKFEAILISGGDDVLIGVEVASQMQGQGDALEHFEVIDEDVFWALEELRSKMDAYSEIKFTFYFFYA